MSFLGWLLGFGFGVFFIFVSIQNCHKLLLLLLLNARIWHDGPGRSGSPGVVLIPRQDSPFPACTRLLGLIFEGFPAVLRCA